MTTNKCFEYNHPTKPKGLICADGSTWNHFSWEGLTSNQIASQHRVSFAAGGTSSPSIFKAPMGGGPMFVFEVYIPIVISS